MVNPDFEGRAETCRRWFEASHPELAVFCIADFNEKHLFLSALPRDGSRPIPGHTYLIDKKSGEMRFFSPVMDLEKYRAMKEKAVYYNGETDL